MIIINCRQYRAACLTESPSFLPDWRRFDLVAHGLVCHACYVWILHGVRNDPRLKQWSMDGWTPKAQREYGNKVRKDANRIRKLLEKEPAMSLEL